MHVSPSRRTGRAGSRFPFRPWIFPAILAVLATALALTGDTGRLLLRFDRAGTGSGEWWRLVSGHFIHLGWSHLALNAAGLFLVWLLVGRAFSGRVWLAVLTIVTLGTSAGLWWMSPQVSWYVGLSGLLHGLLTAGLLGQLRRAPAESGILLVALAGKLAAEQLWGPLPGSEASAGGPVVVDAHFYGAIAGALGALPVAIRDFRNGTI